MMPELHTEGNESGSWDGEETWQTPTAQDANGRTHHNQRDGSKRASLLGQVAMWATPCAQMANGEPEAFLERKRRSVARGNSMGVSLTDLNMQVKAAAKGMWPTVRSSDGERGGRGDLIQAVRGNPNSHYKLWPTPTVQDASNNRGPSQMERNTLPLNAIAGGALNPTWVEWLMGWPLGWTDCGASGMDRFRQWCGSHGKPLTKSSCRERSGHQ
jgi:hypothetical protein